MRNISRIPKIIGILIYFFVLITSFYHVFKFYEIFEGPDESFVAFFVAFGFELSVLYFAYIYTKYGIKSSKQALYLSLFIVWFGNVFVMTQNLYIKQFEIALLNLAIFKFTLPILGSIFIPIGSYYIGKTLANLDMLREDKDNKEEVLQKEASQPIFPEIYKKIYEWKQPKETQPKETAVNINIMAAVEEKQEVTTNIQASDEPLVENHETEEETLIKEIPPFHLIDEDSMEIIKPIEEITEEIIPEDLTKATLKQKILELFRI